MSVFLALKVTALRNGGWLRYSLLGPFQLRPHVAINEAANVTSMNQHKKQR